jgi:hypothetical protein
MTLVIRDKR